MGEVGGLRVAAGPVTAQPLDQLPCRGGAGVVMDGDRRAAGGQVLGDGGAGAARGTGDQRHLAGEGLAGEGLAGEGLAGEGLACCGGLACGGLACGGLACGGRRGAGRHGRTRQTICR